MSNSLSHRAREIRRVIHDFIDQRLQTKIEKLSPEDEKYQAEQDKHVPEVWLADTINKIDGIQVVTHPFRMTNSQVRIRDASSFYCPPDSLVNHGFISTCLLGSKFSEDLTGGAAAFPSYTFLQERYEGLTLLELAAAEDIDFIAALNNDNDIAQSWMEKIKNIYVPRTDGVASHTFGKQIFWLCGDDPYEDESYVLLAPIYSSSLSHNIYQIIQEDIWGEKAKEAREARKKGEAHDGVIRHYPNLASLQLGGSNTQNVSQLNNRMRGRNYLLSSQPPSWKSSGLRPPFGMDSIFTLFSKQRYSTYSPHYWLDSLKDFLAENPPANMKTRNRVEALVNGLLDELYLFTLDYQQLEPGWSADSRCQLPMAQQCWLDPARALSEVEFAENWLSSDWPTQIENAFSRWLNAELGKKIDYLGDVEFRRWAAEMRTDGQWAAQISNAQKTMRKKIGRRGEDVITT